jgi:hypothetical protein
MLSEKDIQIIMTLTNQSREQVISDYENGVPPGGFFVRLFTLLFVIGFGAGLIYFWYWIGNHFTDAPAGDVFDSLFVGMVLFMIVYYGGGFLLSLGCSLVVWLFKGKSG